MDAAMWAGSPGDADVRRRVATVGRTKAGSFAELTVALWRARLKNDRNKNVESRLDEFAARATTIAYRDPIELADLAIDGEDLSNAGIPPGRARGKTLQVLLQHVIEHPEGNMREQLFAHAKKYSARQEYFLGGVRAAAR